MIEAKESGEPDDRDVGINDVVTSPLDEFRARITKIVVIPKGEPMWSERATSIEIDDEAAGEFVKVSQQGGHTEHAKFILIDPVEWPMLRDSIDKMIGECRSS